MARFEETLALTRVRVLLFTREPEAVFWVLVFPLVLALVLGWAFQERAPEPARVAVLAAAAAGEGATGGAAADNLPASAETAESLAERLRARGGLDVELLPDRAAAERALAFGQIAVLVEPGDPITLRHDPQRPEAELARLRVEQALLVSPESRAQLRIEEQRASGTRYIDWLFPGLLGMNLMGTGIWGIGFAIADLRNKKLMRRLLVTPMHKSSFLLAFLLSRLVFLVVEVAVLVLFAVLVLGVPLRGSLIDFVAVCLLGTLAFAALGVLIASRARTLEGVSGLMNLCMMPMWLFSGVFFAYDRFPEAAHAAIRLLPLTAVNDLLRAVMMEGTPLSASLSALAVLATWALGSFAIALRIFRWQ